MIRTLMRIAWLKLKRDYVALGLTFVLPIIFFSIFALIFGGMSSGGGGVGGSKAMRIIVVDEDATEVSRRFVEAIDAQSALAVITAPPATEEDPNPAPFEREGARTQVRSGEVPAAVIVPGGFGASFGSFAGDGVPVEVIYDSANPIAEYTVSGLMQAAAMMAAPDILMENGLDVLEQFGGALTPGQRDAVDTIKPFLRGDQPWDELEGAEAEEATETPTEAGTATETVTETGSAFEGLVVVKTVPARASTEDDGDPPSIVAYYAAGIAVMFLLFSMAGAGGSILEEEETGTLERLLTSRVSMGTLLLSNWVFYAFIGVLQVVLMFVWGAMVFGLDLFTARHLMGFAAMTVPTAAAASSFGIILATLCRSRAQLEGFSTVLILVMSALGGSMVPRFIMPAFMERVSKLTFNGWALDGYLKVFWYDDPDLSLVESLLALAPQVAVLAGMTIVFLFVARLAARRWETT